MPTPAWNLSSKASRFGAVTASDLVAGGLDLLAANRLVSVAGVAQAKQALLADGVSAGVLTLAKAGSTARTVTFPDAAITVAGINLAQTWTAAQSFAAIGCSTLTATGLIDLTTSTGVKIRAIGATTDSRAFQIGNTGGDIQFGLESSAAGGTYYGSAAYDAILYCAGLRLYSFATKGQYWNRDTGYAFTVSQLGTPQLTIADGGAATFASSVSCASLTSSGLIQGTIANANYGQRLLAASGKYDVYPWYDGALGVYITSTNIAGDTYQPMSWQASAFGFYNGLATFAAGISSTSGAFSGAIAANLESDSVLTGRFLGGYLGYTGIRQDATNHDFNIDVYNGGSLLNALKIAQNGSSTFASSVACATSATVSGKVRMHYDASTGERGMQVKLINKTGAATVKGTICSTTTTDMAFEVTAGDAYDPAFVVYESGVADASEAWVWCVGSVCEVLLKDGTAATRDYWCKISDTAGRADITNAAPPGGTITALEDHSREVGHGLESKSSGTNVLAKITFHTN